MRGVAGKVTDKAAIQMLRGIIRDLKSRQEDLTTELLWTKRLLDLEISGRKEAEEALATQEGILASIAEGVSLFNEDGTIVFTNPALDGMFGYERGELIGKNISVLEDLDEEYRHLISGVFGTSFRSTFSRDVSSRRKDGSGFLSHMRINSLEIEGKKYFVAAHEDVTERKKAERELRNALADLEMSNRELKEFAYVASHDLQEPLRNIVSCVQLLDRRFKGQLSRDADRYINYAVQSAVKMTDLIDALLSYSRVRTKEMDFVPTDCEEVLYSTLADLRGAIDESRAEITHDPLPVITADPTQMGQLMQNLISNGIKFSGNESPRIHISASAGQESWIFSVEDNGIGIESESLDRIFVIFQRLHSKDEYPGTGIGLAITKKIVERHGGKIWAESQPGKGTVFHFTIPIRNSTE